MKNLTGYHERADGCQILRFSNVSASVVLVASITASSTLAQQTTDVTSADAAMEFSETAHDGLLFLNGEFIRGPYVVKASAESVFVNGVSLTAVVFETRDGGRRGGRGEGGRGEGGRGEGGRGEGGRGEGGRGEGGRGEGGRGEGGRGEGGRGEGGRGSRGSFRGYDGVESGQRGSGNPFGMSAAIRGARLCHSSLRDGDIVVAFDNQPLRTFTQVSHEYEFCEAMLAAHPTNEQIENFVQHAGSDDGRLTWRNWLRSYSPDPDLCEALQARVDAVDQVEAQNLSDIAANMRLDRFAYPLTVVGMLLGVIAFGHMLKWMSKGFGQHDGATPEAERFVVVALWLMMGMSVLDLVWTILAGQAGVMTELNPLAAKFIDSPGQLAFFKMFATATGFGILFVWRQRRQVQQAIWWMCLVCVLLTFRWVMFDSMIN